MPVFSLVLSAVYTVTYISLHLWHLNSWSHFHSAFNVHTMEVLPRDLALFSRRKPANAAWYIQKKHMGHVHMVYNKIKIIMQLFLNCSKGIGNKHDTSTNLQPAQIPIATQIIAL